MDNQLTTDGKALERVNLMLTRDDSAWLDMLANQIRTNTGAKISRSEIVRAALTTMAELHRLAPMFPDRLMPLQSCKTKGELAVVGILAVRRALQP